MAAGDGAQLPATIAASRSVEKALEEAAASGALNLSNRKLKEFPRTARNHDLSDITYAGKLQFFFSFVAPNNMVNSTHNSSPRRSQMGCLLFVVTCFASSNGTSCVNS